MKWIGQHIYDLVSRFRDDVYLEDISTGTIAEDGHLGLDSNNKIVKAVDGGGDLTSIVAGTGLGGTSLTGPIPTLNIDASQPTITTLAGLTSFGAAGATTNIVAGDVTMYNAVNDGNPTISLGSAAANRLEIKSVYNSSSQDLCDVDFTTYTGSSSTHDGRFNFYVDEVIKVSINDTALGSYGSIFANADGAYISTTNSAASSATEGGKLRLIADDGAAMGDDHRLGVIEFAGAEDASNNLQTGARIEAMCDASWGAFENGTRLDFYTMDGNASTELSLTLDSNLLATFAGGVTVTGTITGDVTGDLTGQADTVATIAGLAPNTATTQATQPAIESIGTDGDTLAILADTLLMSNTSADTPVIKLVNTTDDDQAGQLVFEKLRDDDAVATGQNLGEIWFKGQDNAQNTEDYAYIVGKIDVGTGGQESGKLQFGVAAHDGSTRTAMTLTGGSEATEVDATIGLGANSVTTIAGSLRPTGQIQLVHQNFKVDLDTTKYYVGLTDADSESTDTTQNDLPMVAPVAGKLLKVFIRCNNDISGKTISWRLETQATGVDASTGPSVVGTTAGAGPTASSMVTIDFTNADSGDNLIDAGDLVFLSLQSAQSTSLSKYFITCMFEWDFSGI